MAASPLFAGLSRRQLLAGVGGLLLGQGLGLSLGRAADSTAIEGIKATVGSKSSPRQLLLSGRKGEAGGYRVTALTDAGDLLLDLELPARGHGLAASSPRKEAVIFARRPGTFALVFSLDHKAVRHTIMAAPGRHFFGHGVYSPDGMLLYATENDYDGEQGVIGIYAADQNYRRVGEWPLGDIGPHQLCLGPDGMTLVIAVGGILTHPDLPRMKLNIPSMEPALLFMDRRDGKILQRHRLSPDLHLLSIRHLDVNARGDVAVGLQYQGPISDLVPLVAVSEGGQALRPLDVADSNLRAMKNYCGSVAFDRSGQHFAVSCPRGNRVTFWSLKDGRFLSDLPLVDGCGLARGTGQHDYLLSSGAAGVRAAGLSALAPSLSFTSGALDGVPLAQQSAWDNHMLAVDLEEL
ncbi:DUF1513 domain-containing protein [Rhodovibrionaceae bacterium A322]